MYIFLANKRFFQEPMCLKSVTFGASDVEWDPSYEMDF